CGVEVDDRPLELDYLTAAIFEPTCAATQCHSTFRQAGGLIFDSPEHVRASLQSNFYVRFNSADYDPDNPARAPIIRWVTELDPFGIGVGRMPFDAPMPNRDVELLMEWISVGAPGAQCDPTRFGGRACNDNEIVQCNDDWTF